MSRRRFLGALIGSAAVFCMWLGAATTRPCAAQGPGNQANGLARAIAVQDRHTNDLMSKAGVVGTAVGLNAAGQHVVQVLVATPQDVAGIVNQLDGVPVAVLVTGRIVALKGPPNGGGGGGGGGEEVDPTARFDRPVPIGVSTGHPSITAGTIGCRVTDGTNVYALSNNHVYAASNSASDGDGVIQPGTFDGGSLSDDYIGMLAAFAPIDFSGGDNTVDAAIASTTTALLGTSTPSDGYGTPKSATIAAALNMKVKKNGRTTGETKGTVYAINATVDVGYSTGVARFVNQIIITPGSFSAGGDSGSLVVVDGKGQNRADDRKPVGLLFAGSSFVTIANPIDAVLSSFSVTVDGE